VAINGGAVELAWTVRTEDARPTDCVKQGIMTVSLCVRDCTQMLDGVCTGETQCPFVSFPCARLHGATPFSITPGQKELWITATCANGAVAGGRVPESVLRDVTEGDVTQLNALLISVPSAVAACGP
jgi:hypothetical protein